MFNNIYLILVYKCMNEVDIYLYYLPKKIEECVIFSTSRGFIV